MNWTQIFWVPVRWTMLHKIFSSSWSISQLQRNPVTMLTVISWINTWPKKIVCNCLLKLLLLDSIIASKQPARKKKINDTYNAVWDKSFKFNNWIDYNLWPIIEKEEENSFYWIYIHENDSVVTNINKA